MSRVKRRKVIVSPVQKYDSMRIRKVREAMNLSPMVFAEALGVSLKTVEAWEAGINIPKGPTARILQLLEKDRNLLDSHQVLQ